MMKRARAKQTNPKVPRTLPPGVVARQNLQQAGVSNPTFRQRKDEIQKARAAETESLAGAEAILREMYNSHVQRLKELRKTAPTVALHAGEICAALFLDLAEEIARNRDGLGEVAVERIARFACRFVANLNSWVEHEPERFKSVAGQLDSWPVLLSRSPESREMAADLVERLSVGERGGIRTVPQKKKGFKLHGTTGNKLALQLKQEIELAMQDDVVGMLGADAPAWAEKARDLPSRIDKSCSPQWASVAWEVLMEKTGGAPEKYSDLAKLGEARAIESAFSKQHKRATTEGNVRDGIQARLILAFDQIAPPVP
jgi:hypothetical protein